MEEEPQRRGIELLRRVFRRFRPERVELVRENLRVREVTLHEREAKLEDRREQKQARGPSKKRRVLEGFGEALDPIGALGEFVVRVLLRLVGFLLEALADF